MEIFVGKLEEGCTNARFDMASNFSTRIGIILFQIQP